MFMPYPILHIRFSEILKIEFARISNKNYSKGFDLKIHT